MCVSVFPFIPQNSDLQYMVIQQKYLMVPLSMNGLYNSINDIINISMNSNLDNIFELRHKLTILLNYNLL